KNWTDADRQKHIGKVGGERNLIEIEVKTNDGYLFSYLVKRPGKSVCQAVAEAEQKKDITAMQNYLIACVLEGDKEAYEHDGAIYTQLIGKITKLVNEAKADIKKP